MEFWIIIGILIVIGIIYDARESFSSSGGGSSMDFMSAVLKLEQGDESALKVIESYAIKKNENQDLACSSLGDYYRHKNEKTSASWFLKGAKLGNIGCQSEMSAIYKEGIGVPQDEKKAFEMMKLSADNPNPSTLADKQAIFCTTVGAAYLAGAGIKKDKKKAKEYFQKSCDKGDQAGCDALERFDQLSDESDDTD